MATRVDVLDRRSLNRALLARQLLLQRHKRAASAVIERLVGMQAQAPYAPYVGLWTRLVDFRPAELARLLTNRRAVRVVLMRGTVHLVMAPDCLELRPLVQPVLDRAVLSNMEHGAQVRELDLRTLVEVARPILEQPRANAELGELLAPHFPGSDPRSLVHAVRTVLPLIQVPPRGVWGQGGQVMSTTPEAWLGASPNADPSIDDVLLRYFGAFGPASVRDAQKWSGLTHLNEVVERLRPRLRVFRDEQGRDLFDLPRAPRPDQDAPAPVRFLPEFDNILLSHDDRARIIDPERKQGFTTKNGLLATVLVDGFVAGTWKVERAKGSATLVVKPFERLSSARISEVVEEGAALLAFLAVDETEQQVRVTTGVS